MKHYAGLLVAVSFGVLFLATQAGAQGNKISIAAGTPEDHDLQLIRCV